MPCVNVNVQVVGDDFVGDVGLPKMLGDAVKCGRLHVETVGLGAQILQEISGIDVRRHETVGGVKLPVNRIRYRYRQRVGEHRVAEKSRTAGDNLGDAQYAPDRCGVRTRRPDVQHGEILVLVFLHE